MPRALVWDNESAVGQWRAGRPQLTEAMNAFRGTLGIKVIQCRPADPEAKGLVERANGYLPGSTLVIWRDLFSDPDRAVFKSRDEIRALLTKAGVGPADQVVTYCAIGMRASLMYFAARYAGFPARVYVGSWEDWSRQSGYPIVRRH